jgi:hypothetical protein
MALYYDNPTSLSAAAGSVAVERVYALRFAEFGEAEWQQLMRLYETLPAWEGEGEHRCSCWFGKSESAPYLLASVEPSGLVVTGVLQEREWERWHTQFVSAIGTLPTIEV